MALKIRLRLQGRKNRPSYRLVLIDSRRPRDGKYHENLGWYNPLEAEAEKNLLIKGDRVAHWLENGAIMSERVAALVKNGAPAVYEQYLKRGSVKLAKACAKKKVLKKKPVEA